MRYEVEFKFPVDSLAEIRQRAELAGAEFVATQRQVDTYFAHPSRDFAQTDEAFRLRQTGDENRMTYKGPLVDAVAKTRHEIEIGLAAGVDVRDQASEMLKCLGFGPVLDVAKTRTVLKLSYQGRSVELALDEVDGLGGFVELETMADDAEREAAQHDLTQLAEDLRLSGAIRRSYLSLLLEQKGVSG